MRMSFWKAAWMLFCISGSPPVWGQSIEEMQRQGWKLTFQDEFDGTALDGQKWVRSYHHGKIINRELQAYIPDAFVLKDGILNIVAERKQAVYDGKTMDYTSGVMTTCGKFSQTYGYFEARCKVPAGKGFWPAFWMLPLDHSWPPEIDIVEFIGHERSTIHCTNHWRNPDGKRGAKGQGVDAMVDYSADFHTYAVQWEPGKITWYVDGQPVAKSTDSVPQKDFYLILNFAVGGDWPKDPDNETVFPNKFEVDYVRAYQRENKK